MCKIMAMAGLKPENRENAWKFAQAAAKVMSQNMEKDGFGYAAITADGLMFGERWVYNSQAFVDRETATEEELKVQARFKDAVYTSEPVYNSFGTVDPEAATAILLHARFATSSKGLANTHPFVYDNHTALIHNGVISNIKDLELRTSTCDSETILNAYVDVGVDMHPNKIVDVAQKLEGYYACGVLTTNNDAVPVLDIFKDDRASLVMGRVKELGCLVFSTNKQILEDACAAAGFTLEFAFIIKPFKLLRLNATNGNLMGIYDITKVRRSQGTGGSSGTLHYYRGRVGAANSTARGAYTETHEDVVDDDITEDQIKELLMRRGDL